MPASGSLVALAWIILCCQSVVSGTADDTFEHRASSNPQVSIIIDDLGYRNELDRRALALKGDVTFSILPHAPNGVRAAQFAQETRREVLLHLPMEAINGKALGPGGITGTMNRERIDFIVQESLDSVPYVVGVNNHMGSRLTQNPTIMGWLMDILVEHKLFFIDSKTSAHSVATDVAAHFGLRYAERSVFLDNDKDKLKIAQQFSQLVNIALRDGKAIGIGHPFPETISVLKKLIPTLEHQGIDLVRVSKLTIQSTANVSRRNTRPTPSELAQLQPVPLRETE